MEAVEQCPREQRGEKKARTEGTGWVNVLQERGGKAQERDGGIRESEGEHELCVLHQGQLV